MFFKTLNRYCFETLKSLHAEDINHKFKEFKEILLYWTIINLTFQNVLKSYDKFGQFDMPFKAFIQNKSFVKFSKFHKAVFRICP